METKKGVGIGYGIHMGRITGSFSHYYITIIMNYCCLFDIIYYYHHHHHFYYYLGCALLRFKTVLRGCVSIQLDCWRLYCVSTFAVPLFLLWLQLRLRLWRRLWFRLWLLLWFVLRV